MKNSPDCELVALYLHDPQSPAAQQAAAEIYNRYWSDLVKSLTGRLFKRDRSTAEDIAQNTFINLFRFIDQYNPARESLFCFILFIARTKFIDELRRSQFRPATLSSLLKGDGRIYGTGSTPPKSDCSRLLAPIDPGQHEPRVYAEAAEMVDLFWKFVNSLNAVEDRDLLIMALVEQRSKRDIAIHLGISRPAVYDRLAKFAPALKEKLNSDLPFLDISLERRKSPRRNNQQILAA